MNGGNRVTVKRVVANIRTDRVDAARSFYSDILGMTVAMDQGWIITFASPAHTTPQLSVACEGGSGTEVPDISIEVDNFEEVHRRVIAAGFSVEYGPAIEPWGVKRLYTRDPFGRLLNILTHV